MSVDWSQLQDIFDEAWPLDQESRRAFLAQRCGENHQLRAEVERMLRAFDEEEQASVGANGKTARLRLGVWETVDLPPGFSSPKLKPWPTAPSALAHCF